MDHFLPMRIVIATFDGAQTLDLTGPAEVFANASRDVPGAYEVVIASTSGGPKRTTSGFSVSTVKLASLGVRPGDTGLVVGGEEEALRAALGDRALSHWVRSLAPVGRLAAVCSGAFVLAHAGVLDGLRVATHWSACDRLAAFRPALTVDRESVFVRQGTVWTSAGVTCGIDMALAMVEDDLGRAVADAVAARLVLYVRRPGFQSQFSDALVAQTEASDPLAPAISWVRAHLGRATVEGMAKRAGVSLRTLHRRCLEHTGSPPAKLLERLRVERAKELLSRGQSVKSAAHSAGFGSAVHMRRAFARVLGLAPREVSLLFARRET